MVVHSVIRVAFRATRRPNPPQVENIEPGACGILFVFDSRAGSKAAAIRQDRILTNRYFEEKLGTFPKGMFS
jgi:hypothetical protein